MSYDSQIAALSPWGYWKCNETSGNLADSSGNSRTMTVTGTPTYAQTGPDGSTADAVSWTNTASQHAETTATSNAGAFTYVCWVYLASTPAASVAIMSRAIAYNTVGAADGRLYIDSAGKLNFSVFAGSTITVTAASALPLNTWVMVTASVGAGGMRLRQNKTSVGTNAATTAYTGDLQKIFIRGGDQLMIGTSPIRTSKASYFTSQLSNTDTDALYDAGVPSPNATVIAPPATATAAGLAPTVTAASSVAPPSATATAAGLAPAVTGTGDATVLAPAAAATASGVAPAVTADAALVVPAATASAAGLGPVVAAGATVAPPPAIASADALAPHVDNGSGSQTVAAPAATATAVGIAPTVTIVVDSLTDTTNALNGRSRGGTSTVEILAPVTVPPTPLATRVEKSIPLPMPVLVDGRPT